MTSDKSTDGLRPCSRKCIYSKTACPVSDCRHWIEYEDDYNCCLVTVYNHGPLTLREVSLRIGVTFARIKQIETKALKKIKNILSDENPFF